MEQPLPIASMPVLTPLQLQQLAEARAAGIKIRRAANFASFDGWTIGFFAALTFIGGIFGLSGFVIGTALGIISFIELRGAGLLRKLDLRAPRLLGWNQLALSAVLILYASWNIYRALTAPASSSLGDLSPEDARTIDNAMPGIADLERRLTTLIYLILIGVAILGPGSAALYYFTRARLVREYRARTPEWIQQMQRAGVTL